WTWPSRARAASHPMAGAIPRGEESGFPFLSRTRFSPETWYENETIYMAGTPCTSARTKYHDRGTKSLFGTGVRSHVRHRGDRLRAQIDGPAQPPFRAQAVQRTARGHGDLPELPREDAEGVRGGRSRGAKVPPGPARGGRGPGGRLDDVRRRRSDPGGSAALRHGAGQGPRVHGRQRPSGCEREPDRRPERGGPEPPAAREPLDPVRSDRTGVGARPCPAFQPLLPTRPRAGVP